MGVFFYDPGARIATPLSVDLKRRTITQLSPVARIKPLHARPSPVPVEQLSRQEYHQTGSFENGAGDGLLAAGAIMTTVLVTLSVTAVWQDARRLLDTHGIHHLLLVNDDHQLAGILSDRSLLRYPDDRSDAISLGGCLDTRPIPMASPETSVRTLAYLMLEQGLDAVVVIEGDWVRGIITQRDLLKALIAPHRIDGWG